MEQIAWKENCFMAKRYFVTLCLHLFLVVGAAAILDVETSGSNRLNYRSWSGRKRLFRGSSQSNPDFSESGKGKSGRSCGGFLGPRRCADPKGGGELVDEKSSGKLQTPASAF
ncbi:MAG: hypothetical protein V8S95_04330 [Odoribacter sp.]